MEAAHATWRPLGELIVERGLITEEQLEDALLEQRITHKRLGTILIDKGIVSAQQLTDALVDQIGVEDLLDEFDRTDADPADTERSARALGDPLRRFRARLQDVEPPSPRRLTSPFARLGARTAELGRRSRDASTRLIPSRGSGRSDAAEDQPISPFTVAPAPESFEPAEPGMTTVPAALEVVQDHAPDPQSQPEPEPQQPEEPHAWLAAARSAIEGAEADLARLDNAAVARSHELERIRAELADRESELARESSGHRQAEEEIQRMHALIDDRDAGLTAMEATVEELREQQASTQAELDALLLQFERTSRELVAAQQAVAERSARVAELESLMADYEQRGQRIGELESQTADLAENLSATDETLGIEMHAREQAQREAKRLQDELDDRDGRIAKLARQLEAVEAELQVVVAEREQATRKLRSRERRVTKLESSLAELRAVQAPAAPEHESPAEAEVEPNADEPESAAPTVAPADAEAETQTEAEPEAAVAEAPAEPQAASEQSEPTEQTEQAEGFLYFVPRTGEGYELVEQDGIAPMMGRKIELDGQSFEVTRHSRSPLPFDRRICVYLRLS